MCPERWGVLHFEAFTGCVVLTWMVDRQEELTRAEYSESMGSGLRYERGVERVWYERMKERESTTSPADRARNHGNCPFIHIVGAVRNGVRSADDKYAIRRGVSRK